MKSILDRSFQYTPSAATDLKKTFARIRREQRALDAANDRAAAEATLKVSQLRPAVPAAAR
jgi:hypothetical protein